MKKSTIVIISALVALAIVGGYFFPRQVKQSFGGTSQGGIFNTSTQASVVVNLASPGANATSSSILNSSSNDYYITEVKAGCEGIGTSKTAYTGTGLASLTLAIATSSTSAPATNSNTNYSGGTTITIATSSTTFLLASSTALTGTSITNVIWASGSYITFTTNATNTAVCTFGVHYISS